MAVGQYEEIIYQINNLLKQEQIYPKYIQAINKGKNDFKISQVYTKKNYDDTWIDTIEECLVALDTIVRNPRKFIVVEEDIVDVSLAKSITIESVKHLAQHTNLIASVKDDGTVIPSKILNTSKEESFEVYENRFIYTLLLKTKDFIERRFNIIQNALMQSGEIGVNIKTAFDLDEAKVDYSLSNSANFPFDAAFKKQGEQLSDVERVVRMRNIIDDFLRSPFAKEMKNSALVRPPITRTNVILKDPNFKKALLLWQFVESAEQMEYKIETSTETVDLSESLSEKYRGIVFLNTVLLQSIASIRQGEDSLAKAMEDEKIVADEYITKNIDDFVPDDFPQLKMDLNEIRRIYYRVPGQKTLNLTEIAKINAALDRVIRQYRINQAKEDSITQKRLIAKQLQEEAQAKKLALREARDLERRKKQEEARLRLEARKIEAERRLALKKVEEERIEAERKAEAERRRLEEERLRIEEEERIKEEAMRAQIEEEAKAAALKEQILQEQKKAKEIEAEMKAYYERMAIKEQEAAEELAERKKIYWERERELAIRLAIDEQKLLSEKRRKEIIAKFYSDEEAKNNELKRIVNEIRTTMIVEHYKDVEELLKRARISKSEQELEQIRIEFERSGKSKKDQRIWKKKLKEAEEAHARLLAEQEEKMEEPQRFKKWEGDIYFKHSRPKRRKKNKA